MKTARHLAQHLCAATMGFFLSTQVAHAADTAWWPFEINTKQGEEITTIAYEPLTQAAQPWHLCVLIPHMKDSYFMAVNYGLVKEAERLGVKLTILEAGGYTNLPRQVSQFDDCLTSGADAILTAPISESGLSNKFREGLSKKIPQIVFINPVNDTPVTSKVFVDFVTKGKITGEYLVEKMGDNAGTVVAFPGPQGSGWAESYLKGFQTSLEGSKLELLEAKFGDAGVTQQLRLVEDTLQTYPDIAALWGGAPAAEAAVGAIQEAGMEADVAIMSSYENQAMLRLTETGKLLGFATEFPVVQGRMAVDLAVRALEQKPFENAYSIAPKLSLPRTLPQWTSTLS